VNNLVSEGSGDLWGLGTEHYAFPAEYRVGRWVVATQAISSRIPIGAGGYIINRSNKHGEDYIEVQFIGSPEHRVTVTASSQKRIGYVKLVEATGQSKFNANEEDMNEAVTVRIPHTQVVHHTNPSKLASACRKTALAWKDHACAAAYINKFGKVVLAYGADGELVAGWNPVSRKWIHAVSNKPIIYKTVKERADKVLPPATS
jgi:hypothetical protein